MKVRTTITLAFVSMLAGLSALVSYMVVVSPRAIAMPRLEHAHIRMQLVVDGQLVDFSDQRFQQSYAATCSDALSEQPIHFHDHTDQLVHLHWKNLTGGLILKNYGWNLVGGPDDSLGYRFDRPPLVNRVVTYGEVLPKLPVGASLWVYSGDEHGFKARSSHDFLQQDVETFFNTQSTVNAAAVDPFRDLLFSRASAHQGQSHAVPAAPLAPPAPSTQTQAELARVNNLLGNVVIFVQKDRPTDPQVAERFNKLVPLSDSVCGG